MGESVRMAYDHLYQWNNSPWIRVWKPYRVGFGIGDQTCGAETVFPFEETPVFSIAQSWVFSVVFCISLFVFLSFFCWPLCYLFFLNLQLLVTSLVISNFSCNLIFYIFNGCHFFHIFNIYQYIYFAYFLYTKVCQYHIIFFSLMVYLIYMSIIYLHMSYYMSKTIYQKHT